MAGPRLEITPGMRRFLDYPKFSAPTRMLVLETDYFFDKSWMRAAESLGWETAAVQSVMVGNLTRDDVRNLFTALGEFKPDFVLTSNYAGMDIEGLFARFLEDARIPYVSWFTDTPRMILYDRKVHPSYYAVAATWERGYTQHFLDLGFQHVLYMPLATDPALFAGSPSATPSRRLAFVGTSMTEQANEAWEKLAHRPEVVRAIQEATDDGRVTRAAFAEGVRAILDPALLDTLDTSERRNAELAIVYEATRRQRTAMVRRLALFDVEVRGDAHWAAMTRHAGGPVGYYDDLAPFYRDTAINLNSTSVQMESAVNQRVFDCPAAGGFLITDAQADIEDLFDPETEAVTYRSLDELEDKVAHYLAHPDERLPIIERAQRRVAAHHTHAHRLEALEGYLKERYQA